MNAQELARRKFRDIAVIGGLVFSGMPGSRKGRKRHLQSSSGLVYDVIAEAEPHNLLLLQQAYSEALAQEMEWERLWSSSCNRIACRRNSWLPCLRNSRPFSFPIKVDSLRETLSSEKAGRPDPANAGSGGAVGIGSIRNRIRRVEEGAFAGEHTDLTVGLDL